MLHILYHHIYNGCRLSVCLVLVPLYARLLMMTRVYKASAASHQPVLSYTAFKHAKFSAYSKYLCMANMMRM